jgi:hypothetical protein
MEHNNNLLPIQIIKNDKFIDEVKKQICEYYKLDLDKVMSKNRKREYVLSRQIGMYFSRKFLVYATLKAIGKHFNKDHASVSYSVKQINALCFYDKQLKADIDTLDKILSQIHKSIMVNNPLDKNEYFINLNYCNSIKLSNDKAIVTVGLNEEETNTLLQSLGSLGEAKVVKHKDTGMYILLKDGN